MCLSDSLSVVCGGPGIATCLLCSLDTWNLALTESTVAAMFTRHIMSISHAGPRRQSVGRRLRHILLVHLLWHVPFAGVCMHNRNEPGGDKHYSTECYTELQRAVDHVSFNSHRSEKACCSFMLWIYVSSTHLTFAVSLILKMVCCRLELCLVSPVASQSLCCSCSAQSNRSSRIRPGGNQDWRLLQLGVCSIMPEHAAWWRMFADLLRPLCLFWLAGW